MTKPGSLSTKSSRRLSGICALFWRLSYLQRKFFPPCGYSSLHLANALIGIAIHIMPILERTTLFTFWDNRITIVAVLSDPEVNDAVDEAVQAVRKARCRRGSGWNSEVA